MEHVERADRIERTALALAAVALAAFAIWRVRLGTTFSDDGHYVALAMRLAGGARVFTDEMNVQALGSLMAVPFTKPTYWPYGRWEGISAVLVESKSGRTALRWTMAGFLVLLMAYVGSRFVVEVLLNRL